MCFRRRCALRRSLVLVATALIGLSGCSAPVDRVPDTGSVGTHAARGSITALDGCPPIASDAKPAIVDYVDFVRHAGVEYLAGMGEPATVRSDQVGLEQFRVTCNFSELNRVSGRQPGTPGDGAAGRLAVGTPVHAVNGWSPRCRLAANQGAQWHVYLATVPGPRTMTFAACARSTSPAPETR